MTKKVKKETRYRLFIDFRTKEDMEDWCACEAKRAYKIRERDTLDDYLSGVRHKKFVVTGYAN